jgi:DNA-binding FadR family transcriptional regulator
VTVYRRPDPIPLRRSRPSSDVSLHAVRSEQEDLHRLVSRQIFAAIAAGAYPEGSILPNEDALSQDLGVSRTALRESVKGLVAKGVLETRRRRGTLVLSRSTWNMFDPDIIAWLSREDAQLVGAQLLETLRIAIPGAAALAAKRRLASSLSGTALAAGDPGLKARAEFLLQLGAASHNQFVASLISSAVRGLIEASPRQLDAWSGWLTPGVATRLAEQIHRADPGVDAFLARHLEDARDATLVE